MLHQPIISRYFLKFRSLFLFREAIPTTCNLQRRDSIASSDSSLCIWGMRGRRPISKSNFIASGHCLMRSGSPTCLVFDVVLKLTSEANGSKVGLQVLVDLFNFFGGDERHLDCSAESL